MVAIWMILSSVTSKYLDKNAKERTMYEMRMKNEVSLL